MNKQLLICRDTQIVAQQGASLVIASARRVIDSGRDFSLVLSGGSTPRALFEELASRAADIDWSRVHLFWSDERCVPPDHKDSNYRMAYESLISRVPIPADHVHRIKGEIDTEKAAEEYEQVIRRYLVDTSAFDLILLGMGEDGHTASLFPHTDALQVENRIVVSNYIDKFASNRITMTAEVINNAECVMFLVSGKGKADVLARVLEGEYQPEVLPSQLINPVKGHLIWLVDLDSASNLECAREMLAYHTPNSITHIVLQCNSI